MSGRDDDFSTMDLDELDKWLDDALGGKLKPEPVNDRKCECGSGRDLPSAAHSRWCKLFTPFKDGAE